MGYGQAGQVSIVTDRVAGLATVTVEWVATSGGDAVSYLQDWPEGILERVVSFDTGAGAGTHDIYLYDAFDSDVLDGKGVAASDTATTTIAIYKTLAVDTSAEVYILGPHTFRIANADASDWGQTVFYVRV